VNIYQENVELPAAASKQKVKKQLLDAESAECDAFDHPSLLLSH